MQGSKKIPLNNLNPHIICKLCNGYFVDATTIIECLHSFCRSCIVKYLEKNRYCPVCDVLVHKTKPLLNIRPDKTIQDMVYKLVPRFFQNETKRRQEFYKDHPESKPSNLEQCSEAAYQHLLVPEETVCLTMVYHESGGKPRYLRCPAAVTVNHLKKLIRAKYDLTENHRVDVLYNQDCLSPNLTLMDIAYIYLWKKKRPIDLTYRIYENIAKKPKLDTSESSNAAQPDNANNNNWKEVQLRISENGEMSITDIQDSSIEEPVLELVNTEPKYKNDVVMVLPDKKDVPELKPDAISTPAVVTSSVCASGCAPVADEIKLPPISLVATNEANICCATLSSETNTTTVYSTINTSKCSTTSGGSDYVEPQNIDVVIDKVETRATETLEKSLQNSGMKRKRDTNAEVEPPSKQSKPTILNHTIGLLNLSNNHPLKKHSKMNRNGENINIPKIPTSEVTITPAVSSVKPSSAVTVLSSAESLAFPKPQIFQSKSLTANQPSTSRPGTPISLLKPAISILRTPKLVVTSSATKAPCYVPKPHYAPNVTLSKAVTLTMTTQSLSSNATTTASTITPAISTSSLKLAAEVRTLNANYSPTAPPSVANPNNKLTVKSKASTPIGYKTLRDPPKSWNSQISKANLSKSQPDPKVDLKSVRPAKFFKMRNNMPRYLGNPASGVKPMYQVHVSPDKEKTQESLKVDKGSEIKKHSIVKIDPKTLKPISEKAPEMTSLSNHRSHSPSSATVLQAKNSAACVAAQALANQRAINQAFSAALKATLTTNSPSTTNVGDLKINTSSVSIFNPLKLQSSSPKGERKSPKSPHSQNIKTAASPTGTNKREKPKVNFTPPNPFVPMSPTGSPFLYGAGMTTGNVASTVTSPSNAVATAGGFPPPYDPRVMAAYQYSLWYGQRMAFPGAPLPPGLAQFDVMAASHAAAQAAVAAAAAHAQQQASGSKPGDGQTAQNIGTKRTNSPKTILNPANATITSRTENLPPKSPKLPLIYKKSPKENKNEKSLENAVEKLTQNRHKEIASKQDTHKITDIPKPEENKTPVLETKNQEDPPDNTRKENKEPVTGNEDNSVKINETIQIDKKIDTLSNETNTIADTPRRAAESIDNPVEASDKQKLNKPEANCSSEENDKHDSRVDDSNTTTDLSIARDKSDTFDDKSSGMNNVKKTDLLNVASDGSGGFNKVTNSENAAEDSK